MPRSDKREKNFGSNSRPNDRDRPSRGSDRPTFRVRISNVPSNITWRELRDFVRPVAESTYANVKDNEGVVDFTSEEDMLRVIRELDNTTLSGNTVQIAQTTAGKPSDRSNNSNRDYSRGGYNNNSRERQGNSNEGYNNSRGGGYGNSRDGGYNNSRGGGGGGGGYGNSRSGGGGGYNNSNARNNASSNYRRSRSRSTSPVNDKSSYRRY